MEKREFADRLSELRAGKGVSARNMSLSIGQGASYINNIENCINYPTMEKFFYICDYLGITPKEFFDTDVADPVKQNELAKITKGFSNKQMDLLIELANNIKK